jgi:hypothetical protein
MGSALGPWGAAAGGVIGGALGYFGSGGGSAPDPRLSQLQNRDYLLQQAQRGVGDVRNRQAPQARRTVLQGGPDMGMQQQSRDANWALAQRLRAISEGTQQGAGEMAVNRGANTAIAQQQGAAMMSRGPMAGAGALTAARNTAEIGTNAAGQAGIAAMQDQQGAQGLLSQVLSQQRQQDIGVAQMQQQAIFQQAGLDQATSLANAQARLQAMGMNDQAAIAYLAQIQGMDVAEMQARLGREITQMQQPGLMPGLLQAGGQVLAAQAMKS